MDIDEIQFGGRSFEDSKYYDLVLNFTCIDGSVIVNYCRADLFHLEFFKCLFTNDKPGKE